MTKEEIVRKELSDILYDFRGNRAIESEAAQKTYERLREELSHTAVDLLSQDPAEVFENIKKRYYETVLAIGQLSPGIATALEDVKNNIYLSTYNGDIGDETKTQVTKDTRFDLASITKMFTALEALKLHQDGMFDIHSIIDEINLSPYKTLHITVLDILRFKYELITSGRIDEKGITLPRFYRHILKPNIGKNKYVYSDIPYIIAKTLLPNMHEFFNEYKDELGFESLSYDTGGVITGAEDFLGVSDPKARQMMRLGVQPGHAGLFGNVDDVIKVIEILNNGFLTPENLDILVSPGTDDYYTPVYNLDGKLLKYAAINHGTGVFIEHPEGLSVSEVIPGLSRHAFSATGYTGTYATYDLDNGFATAFLPNPISIAASVPNLLKYRIEGFNRDLIDNVTGEPYEPGKLIVSKFDSGKKVINIYNTYGSLEGNRTYTNITNQLKLEQLYTVYKLRLTKRVAKLLASSDLEVEHIDKKYSGGKTFTKKI